MTNTSNDHGEYQTREQPTLVVVYYDDDGSRHISSSKSFASEFEATRYAEGVAKSRRPAVYMRVVQL